MDKALVSCEVFENIAGGWAALNVCCTCRCQRLHIPLVFCFCLPWSVDFPKNVSLGGVCLAARPAESTVSTREHGGCGGEAWKRESFYNFMIETLSAELWPSQVFHGFFLST